MFAAGSATIDGFDLILIGFDLACLLTLIAGIRTILRARSKDVPSS